MPPDVVLRDRILRVVYERAMESGWSKVVEDEPKPQGGKGNPLTEEQIASIKVRASMMAMMTQRWRLRGVVVDGDSRRCVCTCHAMLWDGTVFSSL